MATSQNTLEILLEAQDNASAEINSALGSINDSLADADRNLFEAAEAFQTFSEPAIAAFQAVISSASEFEASMTNIQAVLGATDADMATLNDQILAIAANSRAGPQAAALAFYDIVGGVADATTHMAIFEAAIATAEAGNADLGQTTNALISIMNAYALSADDAGRVSDILTRTVGMGVGTMGDFASALPSVTGLANSMGISFEEVAAATAYLTTQGNTASESTTQLGGMMSALLNPSAAMTDALNTLGYESGRAAVEALGLTGTYEALIAEFGVDAVGPMVGQMEAIRGITALTGEGFTEFFTRFVNGVDGATNAARAIQLQSFAAQWDLVNSAVQVLAIEIGAALLPHLISLAEAVRPIIAAITTWVSENPELVTQIVAAAGAFALFVGAILAGSVISSMIATVGALAGAMLPLAGLAFVLYSAWTNNFLGIQDVVQPIINNIVAGFEFLGMAIGWFSDDLASMGLEGAIRNLFGVESAVEGVIATFLGAAGISTGLGREIAVGITDALRGVVLFIMDVLIPAFNTFVQWLVSNIPAVVGSIANFFSSVLVPAFQAIGTFVQNEVIPRLGEFWAWLQTNVPAAIGVLSGWITDTLIPALQSIGDFITVTVIPAISDFAQWFIAKLPEAIAAVSNWFNATLVPAFQKFGAVIETYVVPFLSAVYDWLATNIPNAITTIQGFINDTLMPAFATITIWFYDVLFPAFQSVVDWLVTHLGAAINTAAGLWRNTLYPALEIVGNFVKNTVVPFFTALGNVAFAVVNKAAEAMGAFWQNVLLPALEDVANWVHDNVSPWIQILGEILRDTVNPAVTRFGDFLGTVRTVLGQISDALDPIITAIEEFALTVANLELPDWLTPGSPTPFEIGLRGITAAMRDLNEGALPDMQARLNVSGTPVPALAGAGVGGAGGGMVINITVNGNADRGTLEKTGDTLAEIVRRKLRTAT